MKTIIKNATIVNEGKEYTGHIILNGEFIERITTDLPINEKEMQVIDATGKMAMPGVIDDQVHFREPGLTHKGEIATESKAALAGGVTSYMEMPNVNPQTTNHEALQAKFERAAEVSFANYSFYLGGTNDNIDEIKKVNAKEVCGIKVFMGSSTGNMLVDNDNTLQSIFSEAPCLITTHCEDEQTIQTNLQTYINKYGEEILPEHHPLIRSDEACYRSSAKAVELAQKYGAKLHVLHLSSAKEMQLFSQGPVSEKKITAEVCVHHLWFNSDDYKKHGNRIKWNPAIKHEKDQLALIEALNNDVLDVVATDHAPHLINEKMNIYTKSASGGPLVQHSLIVMLELAKQGKTTLTNVVKKMCHAPADLYQVDKRGYLREGYKADVVLVDLNKSYTVSENNILYKCKWSPFEEETFSATVTHTFLNGELVYENGQVLGEPKGQKLLFNR